MPKQINIIATIIFFIFVLSSLSFPQESITVTTYYPSPYGVYSLLKLEPVLQPTGSCQPGEMYYDTNRNRLWLCINTGNWKEIPIAADIIQLWDGSLSGNIYNANSGKVGIGLIPGPNSGKLTVGPVYRYNQGVSLSNHSGPRCPCDGDNTIEECGVGFGSVTDLGANCYDYFVDGGGSDVRWEYDRSLVPSTNRLRVAGRNSYFQNGNVRIGVGAAAPAYRLRVYGSVRPSTDYRPASGTAIYSGTIRLWDRSCLPAPCSCAMVIEDGLVISSTCP